MICLKILFLVLFHLILCTVAYKSANDWNTAANILSRVSLPPPWSCSWPSLCPLWWVSHWSLFSLSVVTGRVIPLQCLSIPLVRETSLCPSNTIINHNVHHDVQAENLKYKSRNSEGKMNEMKNSMKGITNQLNITEERREIEDTTPSMNQIKEKKQELGKMKFSQN